jgi:hypothetical protein
MRRAPVSLTIFACLLAASACADSTAPLQGKTAPNGASHTRYILASGDAPPGDCSDLGNGYWLCDDGGELAQQVLGAPAAPAAPTNPDNSGDWDFDFDN